MEEKTEKVRTHVWVNRECLEAAGRLAKKAGMSRNRLLANVLEVNIESLEASDKVGVFQLSFLLRDLAERLKEMTVEIKERPRELADYYEAEA
jgi:hypothetical protein